MNFYRSWGNYQAVTPAPMQLFEQLSPAALQFTAQIKHIAQQFTRGPRGIPGSSTLTPTGEQFYEKVIDMMQHQLIESQLARYMVIPEVRSRLV